MYFPTLLISALLLVPNALAAPAPAGTLPGLLKRAGHQLTIKNNCANSVTPKITDTKCGYSPRCADAAAYSGRQPKVLAKGQTDTLTIPKNWVGRIYAQNGKCGAAGENCSMTEWNMDSGNQYTPNSYDISNIQGYTQAISIGMAGCDTVTCTSANCGCKNAYPVGDLSGCGNDSPVHACGAGDIAMHVTFCP